MSEKLLWGGLELGGTTIKVALAEDTPTNVIFQESFPTGDQPAVAMAKAKQYFQGKKLTALGIASFGPVDLDQKSKTYGSITSTPKPGWADAPIISHFSDLHVPLGFQTDVNAAALAELHHGHHQGNSCAYITVGTGIGAGIVDHGRCIVGCLHPEAGHMPVRRHPRDTFEGTCPFHGGACIEGLSNAPSIAARVGLPLDQVHTLSDEHEVWDYVAWYLGDLCVTLAMTVAPHTIILGGGVLKRTILYDKIRAHFVKGINGYLRAAPMLHPETYIVASRFDRPESHTSSGCVGALELARQAWLDEKHPHSHHH